LARASLWPLALGLALTSPALAQDTTTSGGFWSDWLARATAIQAKQPRWATPLYTTTPRLEQEFRSDFLWRWTPTGTQTTIYTNGKGLELIPFNPVEIIVGVPSYVVHHSKTPDGWGDWPLLLKYRFASGNETHGNYIFTGFFGASLPTGGKANGANTVVLTPTLAGGKGWGDFDVQATAGINLPTSMTETIGNPLLYNITFQYHVPAFFAWPAVEFNGTTWRNGTNIGKNQVFLTPEIVFGRFHIHDRTGFTVGVGVQTALTTYKQYNHNYTLSVRLPF
jgi:hypothetical protein